MTTCSVMDEYTYDDVSLPQADANQEKTDELIQTARERGECLEAADRLEARLETWVNQRTTANYKKFRSTFEVLESCLHGSHGLRPA